MNVQPISQSLPRTTTIRQLTWLPLILMLLLSLIGIQPAYAAGLSLTVDTTSDANLTACTVATLDDCSLRGAINAANAAGGTNTIYFDSTIFFFGDVINLTSALPTITSTIIISGPGASQVKINGGGLYSLFAVDTPGNLTLKGLTLTNGRASFGAAININQAAATVTNSVLSNNVATSRGGAIYVVNSALTLSNTTLNNNQAATAGGAISVFGGTPTLTDCTFKNNKTTGGSGFGGALDNTAGLTTVTGCTFSGNSSISGGAISNGNTLTVTNSTFSGNSGSTGGGVQTTNSSTTIITNSTFSGNSATVNGGGIYGRATVNLNNSIFANSTGGDCYRAGGTLNAQNSLIADDPTFTCVNGTNLNNRSGDPLLSALADNGGPTQTMALQTGSPAINGGDNALAVDASSSPLVYDQRGSGYNRFVGVVDIGAYELVYTPDYVVDRADDVNVSVCTSAPNDCSLRGAINDANATSGVTITFDSSVFTSAATGTITLSADLPEITANMDISGLGRDQVIVDGANSHRPFTINASATVNLSGMTVTHGSSSFGGGLYNEGTLKVSDSAVSSNTGNSGGGIYNLFGTVTVNDSTLDGNTALSSGGGIVALSGTLTVTNSTLDGGSATNFGGGIYAFSSTLTVTDSILSANSANDGAGGIYSGSSTVKVINSTLSGNSATNSGGGIFNGDSSALTVINSTLAENTASSNQGGGIYITSASTSATLNNSIVAGNTGGDCANASTLNAQNTLIQDGTCITVGVNGNLSGDPLLSALADNGGATQTMALQPGSPAINAGDNSLAIDASSNPLVHDQRGSGYARIFGGTVDMGAYELQDTPDIVVDRTDDLNIGLCTTAANDCTLRGAINLANTIGGTDTITFDSSVFTSAAAGTITLSANLPPITTDMDITGLGDTLVIIDGAGSYLPFSIYNATVNISGLTIQNGRGSAAGAIDQEGGILTVSNTTFTGNSSTYLGGGIGIYGGTTTVTNSTFDGNLAPGGGGIGSIDGILTVSSSNFSGNSAGSGGGIANADIDSILTVSDSTFSGNSASSGGGIYNYIGTATVTNSTLYNNSASADGGGLTISGGTVTLTNSTLYNNSAATDQGGGLSNQAGTLTLNNSIIAGSTSGGDCVNADTLDAQNSLIGDGLSCVTNDLGGNLTGDPDLGTLTGSPAYYPLNAGSIAINAGANNLAVDADGNPLTTDEAGNTRIFGGTVDMGAYELQDMPDIVVDRTDDLNIGLCTTSANDCTLRGAINLANSLGGTHTVTFDSSVFNPGTIALGSTLPNITGTIIINGLGESQVIVDGNHTNRVLYVNTGADLTLANLTIANGSVSGAGGSVYVTGAALTATNVTFSGNTSSSNGGAIFVTGADSTATLTNSTLSGNTAGGNGGGLFAAINTTTVITGSTLSGNEAVVGGGIYNQGTLTVTGSTLSGNTSSGNGGGIYIPSGAATITDSTLDNNTGAIGGDDRQRQPDHRWQHLLE